MRDEDEELEANLDELAKENRVNFRDYPSSALVVLAALSSGLAWMAYKWLGKKGAARRRDGNDAAGVQAEHAAEPSKAPKSEA